MKKVLVVMLVLGLASAANAALDLGVSAGPPDNVIPEPGMTGTWTIASGADGAYQGWIEIVDPGVAMVVEAGLGFAPGGNPNGDSSQAYWPDYGEWYEFAVVSLNPDDPIVAGDHILVELIGMAEGETTMNVYEYDGVTLVASTPVVVMPEPVTIALLGLGGLFLRRRR